MSASSFTIRAKFEGFRDVSVITSPIDEEGVLYVAEQRGCIYKIDLKKSLIRKFLDISSLIIRLNSEYDERGIIGLTFHRDYTNVKSAYYGRFYVFYSSPTNSGFGNAGVGAYTNILSEFRSFDLDECLLRTETQILKIPKESPINNGGCLLFNPYDNTLLISIGDDSQLGQVQKLNTFYGKVLRINVNVLPYTIPHDNPFIRRKDACSEIYAYGFKNVNKISLSANCLDGTNTAVKCLILVSDMNQNIWEEINLLESGKNYGWPIKEGFEHLGQLNVDSYEYTDPVFVYTFKDEYTGIIGGDFVDDYDESVYVFSDLSGRILAIQEILAIRRDERESQSQKRESLEIQPHWSLLETAYINKNILCIGKAGSEIYLATSELNQPQFVTINVLKFDRNKGKVV